ncbi:MAG: ketopantoate reductase family protein [Planctomycetaceae bacterium]
MRVLIYGAGNIGQLYAARLKEAGHDVRVLARGRRLQLIRELGIRLEDFKTEARTTTPVEVAERLEPDDVYDLILVVLPKQGVLEVLPILAANRSPNVMFFGNNAAGPEALTDVVGRNRVLPGFPGVGAIEKEGFLRYLILIAREQPTTVGELDGTQSDRIREISDVLRSGGFPVSISSQMDAWLKTHAAEIVPTALALSMAGDNLEKLRGSSETMTLMVRAIREGYRILSALGIPLTPASRRILRWIPERLLIGLMKRKLAASGMEVKVGHASNANSEMELLAAELKELADQTDVATPSLDILRRAHGWESET